MAHTLGKRKRKDDRSVEKRRMPSGVSQSPEDAARDAFKKHFEARFKPLPTVKKTTKVDETVTQAEEDDDSEWEGISECEDGAQVEIIEHNQLQTGLLNMSREEVRVFMSSKPPTLQSSKSNRSIAEEDLADGDNLKNDLALQRLLAESHLLGSSGSPSLSGSNRHKATDLRLQTLGAKTSILKQEKMPMSHRKGIVAKQFETKERRRKEARENGIILEKVKANDKRRKDGKRDRGIGGPGVGKFSGGTLTLSKKDIFDIEGPKKHFSSKGGRGGRGGRGRGGGSRRGRG